MSDVWRRKYDHKILAQNTGGTSPYYRQSDNTYQGTLHHDPAPGVRCDQETRSISYTSRGYVGSIKLTNDCRHVVTGQRWLDTSAFPAWWGTPSPTGNYGFFVGKYVFDAYNYTNEYYSGFTGSMYPEESFNSRAFQAMLPDLETGLSLTNFLLELSDVKHLLTFFTKWDGFSKKVAEGHLSWNFGVKPFIQDVKTLYSVLTDHQRMIDEFLARQNTIQIRHYSEVPVDVSSVSVPYTYTTGSRYRFRYTEKVKWTATMVYQYTCPDLDTYTNKLKALCDMLGLRLTASVVWEAIPFSFVIDWFFRVGDFLKSYEKPLIQATTVVHDYSISCKREWTSSREWSYWGDSLSTFTDYHPDNEFYGKTYSRTRCRPDAENHFINEGNFGLHQLALSASLMRTR